MGENKGFLCIFVLKFSNFVTMRPCKFFSVVMLMLFVAFTASAGTSVATKVKVTNGKEFLRALASNTHIIIPKGTKIMLTEALDDEALRSELKMVEINTYEPPIDLYNKVEALGYYDNFDGNQLVVAGLSNLTIEGEGDVLDGPSIIINPRYAYVFYFLCCENVNLINLTLGHTEEGYCEGGVVMFDHCKEARISGCDMYGCGTEGIGASDSQMIQCFNSYIRDCSYQIMTITRCSDVKFSNCEFFRNKQFSLVNISGSSEVQFKKCKFYDNRGPLFSISNARPVLDECIVRHGQTMLGSIDDVQYTGSQFFESEGEAYDPEGGYPDGEEVSYYDNDWENSVLKVSNSVTKPGIADFFIALAHKSNSPLIKSASLALNPPYKSAVDIVEVDKKNGYIFVANLPENANGSDYRAVEACYWRCNDGSILFAVNHLLQEDQTVVNFYRYDSRRRLLNPITEEDPLTHVEEDVYVALPRTGKSIQYVLTANPEKQVGVHNFDGRQFLYKPTGGRSMFSENATNPYGVGNMVAFLRRY